MFYFKHGSGMFFSNIILSILLALQIATSIFLAGMTFSKVESANNKISVFDTIKSVDGMYVMPAVELVSGDKDIYNYVDKIDGIKEIISIYEGFEELDGLDFQLRIKFYDDFVIDNCKLPLSKGKWFTKKSYGDYVPVVINQETKNLKLGKTFKIRNTNFKIIGVLGKRQQFVTFSNGGNNENITSLVGNYDDVQPMIICPSSFFSQKYLNSFMQEPNFIVLFKDMKEADKKICIKELNDIGFTKSISKLYSDGKEYAKNQLITLSPYIIISFLLALIGVASSITLIMYKQMKKFSIFYICGIPWKNIKKIIPIYYTYLVLLALGIYGIIYVCCINMEILLYYEVMLTIKEWLIIAIIFIFIFIASIVPINIIFKKNQPINILYRQSNN